MSLREKICATALAIEDLAARDRFLLEACGNDANLRAAIQADLVRASCRTPRLEAERIPAFCPACGMKIVAAGLGELCATCVASAALEQAHDEPTGATRSYVAPGRAEPAVPSPAQLAPLFPQLEVIELLGYGGMGTVYLARQKSLDRLVALKMIRPDIAEKSDFFSRFSREAVALARLNHPNIVAVHDFGSVELPAEIVDGAAGKPNHVFYLLMEFVDGANLRSLISARSATPREALAIVPQICEALQFAHDHGIVHRDIKPENILLDRRGRVKIADFGLAKLLGHNPGEFTLTGTHQIMGTPRYMAPEQLEQSRSIDHRADIYSLGVVFYELLTGELPLGAFEPPSRKVQIDVRLDDVVLRSLAKEPEKRYQQASEVRTDIDSIAEKDFRTPASNSQSPVPGPVAPVAKTPGQVVESVARWLSILVWLMIPGAIAGAGTILLAVNRNPADFGIAVLYLTLLILHLLVLIPVALIAIVRLRAFQSWWLALLVVSLVAFSPNPFVLAAFPVGVWAMSVLLRSDIRRVFAATSVSAETARVQLSKGGLALLVSGVVGLLICLAGFFVYWLVPLGEGYDEGNRQTLLIVCVVSSVLSLCQVFGGLNLRNQESWIWSWIGAVLSLANPNPSGLIGFPAGLYSLAALAQRTDGVKHNHDLFSRDRVETDAERPGQLRLSDDTAGPTISQQQLLFPFKWLNNWFTGMAFGVVCLFLGWLLLILCWWVAEWFFGKEFGAFR